MKHRVPAYEAIAENLRKAISTGNLPAGTVLLEGPLAAIFDSSRAPVKQALAALEAEGLVRRFEGRGFLAGLEGEPLRHKVTAEMLALDDEAAVKTAAWQGHYYDFEQIIILNAVFGPARINELALARYYGVGRTVAGDILSHASETGIVTRDEKSRWMINPLDERRFQELYEVRVLLEPFALRTAVKRIPREHLLQMRNRLIDLVDRYPAIQGVELDTIEEDLHVGLLKHASNSEIIEALKRTRCILVAGKHIQRAVRGTSPIDAFMHEHIDIFDALLAGQVRRAERSLVEHLETSSRKAKERLAAYKEMFKRTPVPFIIE